MSEMICPKGKDGTCKEPCSFAEPHQYIEGCEMFEGKLEGCPPCIPYIPEQPKKLCPECGGKGAIQVPTHGYEIEPCPVCFADPQAIYEQAQRDIEKLALDHGITREQAAGLMIEALRPNLNRLTLNLKGDRIAIE